MDKLILKPLQFLSRMSKYTLLPHYLDVTSKDTKLKEIILKEKMKKFHKSFVVEMLNKEEMWEPRVTAEERSKKVAKAKIDMEILYRKETDEYIPIITNQALVQACTILDAFLCDCMRAITNYRPEELRKLAVNGDITAIGAIDAKDDKEILKLIRDEVLKRFDFNGIRVKFKMFRKLKINIDWVFEIKLPRRFVACYPDRFDFLINAYQMRHNIVHKDEMPLKNLNSLFEITDFFSSLIFRLPFEIYRHFKIPINLSLMR